MVASQVEKLLILNGLIVTLVVLSFMVLRRGPKPPVKLDLRDNAGASNSGTSSKKVPIGADNYRPRGRGAPAQGKSLGGAVPSQEKSLNIFFNWNGHAWDAYEVLGVPAGSSPEQVLKAFERGKALADKETLPFLRAAYEAVVDTYTLR